MREVFTFSVLFFVRVFHLGQKFSFQKFLIMNFITDTHNTHILCLSGGPHILKNQSMRGQEVTKYVRYVHRYTLRESGLAGVRSPY